MSRDNTSAELSEVKRILRVDCLTRRAVNREMTHQISSESQKSGLLLELPLWFRSMQPVEASFWSSWYSNVSLTAGFYFEGTKRESSLMKIEMKTRRDHK